MKTCPYCAEEIQDAAILCRYCGHDLRAPVQPVQKRGQISPLLAGLLFAFTATALLFAQRLNAPPWYDYLTNPAYTAADQFWSLFWAQEGGLLVIVAVLSFALGVVLAGVAGSIRATRQRL